MRTADVHAPSFRSSDRPGEHRLRSVLDDIEKRVPGAFARAYVTGSSSAGSTAGASALIAEGFFDLRLLGPGVHEWFGLDLLGMGRTHDADWIPPLSLLAIIAARLLVRGREGRAVFVGERCRPSPAALTAPGLAPLLHRSLLVSVGADPSVDRRAWAMDVALRSPAACVVVGDGRGLSMADTRRLQLAAARVPLLLARPVRELRELSAARTRWLVAPSPSSTSTHDLSTRWSVELLRSKGVRPAEASARPLGADLDHDSGTLSVFPAPVDRRAASA